MNQSNPPPIQNRSSEPGKTPRQTGALLPAILILIGCFGLSLYHLLQFSIRSSLYSHIVLVPMISVYLIWSKRHATPTFSKPARKFAGLLLIAGTLTLAVYWAAKLTGRTLAQEDSLALTTLSFLFLLTGLCTAFIGRKEILTHAFPLCFLVFMVPLPAFVLTSVETFLQHGSAVVAHALFKTVGTPVFNEGLTFKLPGISLEIAPECSGIRSSLALFITSLLAGYFFLRTPWKYTVLAFAVIPLAFLRNGFRVFTIGELCVHLGPDMIDSYIHRQGGPIFFALSLIPFFGLLRLLQKSEHGGKAGTSKFPAP